MTASQSATTPSQASTPNLLDLPVELKTNILSHLDPSDIHKFSPTCRHARDLVEEASNATNLYRSSQARNLERLSQSVSRLSNLHGLTLLDALSIWIAQRGINPSVRSRFYFLRPLIKQWSSQRPISVSRKRIATQTLWELANTLLTIHVQTHLDAKKYEITPLPEKQWEVYISGLFLKTEGFNVEKNLKRYYIDRPTILSWFREIASDPSRLAGPTDASRPDYPLTQHQHFPFDGRPMELKFAWGWILADLIHLPQNVPDDRTLRRLEHFGYCVRTFHAWHLFNLALIHQRISEKDKAVILEQTYLY
ncbi:uncharacterized protein MYCFIDRAFT_193796 [Pseudocercospora fijiensis CIRAD86]|uniref:F-box domain-containing protein n=1 Tax=Pseudocercospora fijiensis (strain CIRAD86) TaxID=383855 RepID=M3A317_PSEFD|nr:uncharacterized protein MYCFIDRAFT_193796 [Pseudocercospora fijiensis CIRAD86]EME85504.1 hypothetical protein MYCFIDRAFT_193796 [Pseudocercospora fijiensis CIRAD86]